ncbi:MAG: hypothetical protein D6812_15400 [Deltaproteobacteria bacterium]|nr:MAG: hypothetical protein D6812_15400 [Deltaproteobacteria bacterium]
MSSIDQFESIFRSAQREIYRYEPVTVGNVLVVTDLEEEEAEAFGAKIRAFLATLGNDTSLGWGILTGSAFHDTADLLEIVAQRKPELICTYRNLQSRAWRYPHSLGEYLDVLTQLTDVPVLVVPHPRAGNAFDHAFEDMNRVMAVTDHLARDDRLVNHAVHFTMPGGTLYLTHIEDLRTFNRYMEAISRIPEIDTEMARSRLAFQLLKGPREYIHSCREVLAAAGVDLTVEEIVEFGRHLREYQRLIETHAVDLLVLNTKDADQLAMHGLAYPLVVELRRIPILLL